MLSTKTRKILTVAMANRVAAAELADAVDSGSNPQAASVAVIPASANLTVPAPVAAAIADTDLGAGPAYAAALAADVNAALDDKADNADVVTLASEVEARLDTLEGKVNAIIAALKAAGLMA
jgi:hypothetical protein